VVFCLAPLIGFPFHAVQIFFNWLLVGLTAASVWLWLKVLRWRLPALATSASMVLLLGSLGAAGRGCVWIWVHDGPASGGGRDCFAGVVENVCGSGGAVSGLHAESV